MIEVLFRIKANDLVHDVSTLHFAAIFKKIKNHEEKRSKKHRLRLRCYSCGSHIVSLKRSFVFYKKEKFSKHDHPIIHGK